MENITYKLNLCADQKSVDFSNSMKMNLHGGSVLHFYKNLLHESTIEKLMEDVFNSDNLRQYMNRNGMYKEPIVHVLLSSKANKEDLSNKNIGVHTRSSSQEKKSTPGVGYRYGSVSMQAIHLSKMPEVSTVATDIANYKNLPGNYCKIGIDVIVYSNEKAGIGFHSDNHQGEHVIFTTVLETPVGKISTLTKRPILIQRKRLNKKFKNGDESIQIFACAGDAYEMNAAMQHFYQHAIPKKTRTNTFTENCNSFPRWL